MIFKLNVLLSKTNALEVQWKGLLKDFGKFFKAGQGAFIGEQRIYNPKDGTVDDPKKRSNVLVVTTVDEKLDYFVETCDRYINSLFSQESTNASGTARAMLTVDGEEWGELTSLELLRLKSLLSNNDLNAMYGLIPVRSDSETWAITNAEMYSGRIGIFQGPLVETENKTTEKEEYILVDPNLANIDGARYVAKTSVRNTTVILGDGTHQRFSGQYSQRQKADILRRISSLKVAVIEALKIANEAEVIESSLTAEKIFGYLHGTRE